MIKDPFIPSIKQRGAALLVLLVCIAMMVMTCSAQIDTSNITPKRVSNKWPDDVLDLKGWIEYAIFILVVMAVIIVIGFILETMDCCVWSFRRCCGLCGGAKYKVR